MMGCIQRQVWRSLVAAGGKPVRTADLLAWAYPLVRRYERWRYKSVYRAAERFAVRLDKDERGVMWGLRQTDSIATD
jgi:hypothetical protein